MHRVHGITSLLSCLLLVPGCATHVRLASAAATQHPEPAPQESALEGFLEAYHTGDCSTIHTFVTSNYHPTIVGNPELVQQFTASFAQLHQEFGPLEVRGQGVDATYEATKYFLYGPVIKEWVALMFVSDANGKIAGHGLWKLEKPPGWVRPPDDRPFDARMRAHLGDLAGAGMFSGAVLLLQPNGAAIDVAAGTADGRRSLTTKDRFPIASVTKMFTAAAVLLLEQAEELSLDDPIARYVPEYPADIAEQVTIRHLLLHTSGIELDDDPGFNSAQAEAPSLDAVVAAQVRFIDRLNEGRRANFRPLNTFDYSNEEYDLLGAIVERVADQPFDAYLAAHVFAPAGLEATSFVGEDGLRGVAHRKDGSPDPCSATSMAFGTLRSFPSPSGGLFSTTSDLRLFLDWLRAPRSGRPSLLDRMMAEQVPVGEGEAYGLGVQLLTGTPRVVGHNGGIAGASAELRLFLDDGTLFVALANRERAAGDLLFRVMDELGR